MSPLLPRFIEAIRAVDLQHVTAPEHIPEAFVLTGSTPTAPRCSRR